MGLQEVNWTWGLCLLCLTDIGFPSPFNPLPLSLLAAHPRSFSTSAQYPRCSLCLWASTSDPAISLVTYTGKFPVVGTQLPRPALSGEKRELEAWTLSGFFMPSTPCSWVMVFQESGLFPTFGQQRLQKQHSTAQQWAAQTSGPDRLGLQPTSATCWTTEVTSLSLQFCIYNVGECGGIFVKSKLN